MNVGSSWDNAEEILKRDMVIILRAFVMSGTRMKRPSLATFGTPSEEEATSQSNGLLWP